MYYLELHNKYRKKLCEDSAWKKKKNALLSIPSRTQDFYIFKNLLSDFLVIQYKVRNRQDSKYYLHYVEHATHICLYFRILQLCRHLFSVSTTSKMDTVCTHNLLEQITFFYSQTLQIHRKRNASNFLIQIFAVLITLSRLCCLANLRFFIQVVWHLRYL